MTSKFAWVVLGQLRKVWVRVVAFAVLAVATVGIAQVVGGLLPPGWHGRLGAGAVDQVLGILASSMLAVTTFSLSVAVSAFAAAAQSATPRATALLQQDTTTQNVLATFLGAFLFSLVGLVALKAGFYTEAGEFVLFAATVLVIVLVVLAFLRWIAHLMNFGRIEDTLDRVEAAAAAAIADRIARPGLGGEVHPGPPPEGRAVRAGTVGYVQHIDTQALAECAEAHGFRIWLVAVPGDFADETTALAILEGGGGGEDSVAEVRRAFSCGKTRSFDQDPRFGVIVLSEIATRALSPAVNDPGTAIGVIGRLVRVLSPLRADPDVAPVCTTVLVPPVTAGELLEDAFLAIARDGGRVMEVQLALQKALASLARTDRATFARAAAELSGRALDFARGAGMGAGDLQRLRDAAPDSRD